MQKKTIEFTKAKMSELLGNGQLIEVVEKNKYQSNEKEYVSRIFCPEFKDIIEVQTDLTPEAKIGDTVDVNDFVATFRGKGTGAFNGNIMADVTFTCTGAKVVKVGSTANNNTSAAK
ncbi:MAG: hypothetical protein ACK5LZ_06205 [Anaerorhabdus sp.]